MGRVEKGDSEGLNPLPSKLKKKKKVVHRLLEQKRVPSIKLIHLQSDKFTKNMRWSWWW